MFPFVKGNSARDDGEQKMNTVKKKTSQSALGEYTLPAYWASYLINGDDSGMSTKDSEDCANFLRVNGLLRAGFYDCGDSYFSRFNDSGNGLAGDVCVFTYATR